MTKRTKNRIEYIFLIIACIVFMALLTSCRSKTVYVPVETIKTEYKDRLKVDSIHVRDSIFWERYKSNDTIFISKEYYTYRYRDKLVQDSIFINDTIKIPYPIVETKTVKAPYRWYEKGLLFLGCILLGIIGANVLKKIK